MRQSPGPQHQQKVAVVQMVGIKDAAIRGLENRVRRSRCFYRRETPPLAGRREAPAVSPAFAAGSRSGVLAFLLFWRGELAT